MENIRHCQMATIHNSTSKNDGKHVALSIRNYSNLRRSQCAFTIKYSNRCLLSTNTKPSDMSMKIKACALLWKNIVCVGLYLNILQRFDTSGRC